MRASHLHERDEICLGQVRVVRRAARRLHRRELHAQRRRGVQGWIDFHRSVDARRRGRGRSLKPRGGGGENQNRKRAHRVLESRARNPEHDVSEHVQQPPVRVVREPTRVRRAEVGRNRGRERLDEDVV